MQASEIDQIIAARDASGLLAAEAYMIVHHPQWQLAKKWLEAGEIGQLAPCGCGVFASVLKI